MDHKHRFCHICRTRKGKGEFKPFEPYISCCGDFGFMVFTHCYECEKTWVNTTLDLDEVHSHYCPFCASDHIEEIDEVIFT